MAHSEKAWSIGQGVKRHGTFSQQRATGSWQEKDILHAEPLPDLASWLLSAAS